MTPEQIIKALRRNMADCVAGEKELYEALLEESEGWKMRLEELEQEEEDEEDEEDES